MEYWNLKPREQEYKEKIMGETIKFIGKVNKRNPQLFPKNGKGFSEGEFAILNFDVKEKIDGCIETNKYGNISIKGCNFDPNYDSNKEYTVLAELENEHPIYGKQWNCLMINESLDITNPKQQRVFLQSFLTETQIRNLFDTFENPLSVIESEDVNKLKEVNGIGDKIAELIIKKYHDNKDYSEAYIQLSSYGLTTNTIKRLCDTYGSAKILINKIIENPYILASEVSGIGFKKADDMALKSGMSRLSIKRLEAFIKHILNEGALAGYSWITSGVLVDKIENELDSFPIEDIVSVVNNLKTKKIIWDGEKGKIALQKYYQMEVNIKNELLRIKNGTGEFDFKDWEERILRVQKIQGFDFTEEQKQAIRDAMEHQVMIITGKAGSGKTSTVLGAIKALGDVIFAQCCLAGKAAARMEEATGYPASTIHRLLGFNPQNFTEENHSMFLHNENCQLGHDVIILDEFSMVGGDLFLSLLKAIPTGSKFIMIGDQGQLPSIGALNIASDLTECNTIHTSYLTEIHRQAKKSAVITESIKISNGEQIIDKNFTGKEIRGELQDLELDIYEDINLTTEKAMSHFKEKLAMSKNDIMEVQLVVPMNFRGKTSAYVLNNLAQEIWNPRKNNKKEVCLPLDKDKEYFIRVDDKIINVKNNYKISTVHKTEYGWEVDVDDIGEPLKVAVFNGYTGQVVDITENDNIIAYFPLVGETVLIPIEHWRKEKGINLGYALSCHKIQGSSFKYPICVLDSSHYVMLSREWLYTAITRSSLYCTVIAENKALRRAISNTSVQNKQTFLKELIEE